MTVCIQTIQTVNPLQRKGFTDYVFHLVRNPGGSSGGRFPRLLYQYRQPKTGFVPAPANPRAGGRTQASLPVV